MDQVRASRTEQKSRSRGATKDEHKVVCFICRKMVPMDSTLELDHTSGRFKIRVCHRHLNI